MEGIIVNLLKDVQIEDNDANAEIRSEFPNLVWMDYDRIRIKKIDKMDDYFILSDIRSKWVGSIQSLHLYTCKETHRLCFDNADGLLVRPVNIQVNADVPAFFCVTSLKLDFSIKSMLECEQYEGSSEFNHEIKGYIDRFLEQFDCTYEIYSSLGAEDFVIIFVSNSIKKFANLIESLRRLEYINNSNVKKKLFETTYSFVGFNNINKIVEPELDAVVSITAKNNKDIKAYIKALEEKGVHIASQERCFGAYDVRVCLNSSKKLIKQYRKDGLLSATSKEYKEYVYQSQTIWKYTESDLSTLNMNLYKPVKISVNGNKANNKEQKIWESSSEDISVFEKIINEENIITQMPHFEEECRILLAEYNRYMNSSFIRQWRPDMAVQFKAFVESIKRFLKQRDEYSPDYGIEAIEECMDVLKETYMHITQASRLFFDSSERARYYNGSFNNILRAYYGLVKLLINIGYAIPHNIGTKQDELAFTINFDVKPKIYSKLYLPGNSGGMRFISFNLPYAALYNMPKYLAYLVHEVFHYITPIDRIARNKLLFKISLDMILRNLLYRFFLNTLNIGHDNKYTAILKNLISSYFDNIVKNVVNDIVEKDVYTHMCKKSFDFFVKDLEDLCLCKTSPYKLRLSSVLQECISLFITHANDVDSTEKYIVDLQEKLSKKNLNRTTTLLKMVANLKNMSGCSQVVADKCNHLSNEYISNRNSAPISGNIQEIAEGLSEAVCDLYILTILGLCFVQYIEILMDLFKDMLLEDAFIENENNGDIAKTDSMCFRLGILVDAYIGSYNNNANKLNEQLEKWKKITKHENVDKKAQKIKQLYNQYLTCYKGYRRIMYDYMRNMNLSVIASKIRVAFGEEALESWKSDIGIVRGFYTQYLHHGDDKNKLFNLNLNMIEFFQSQRPLIIRTTPATVPFEVLDSVQFGENNSAFDFSAEIEDVAATMSQYIDYVIKDIKELKEAAGEENLDAVENIWFRGVCNKTYGLTPSIFRKVPDGISLYAYQVAVLKEFHARLSSYPELLKNNFANVTEQLACMQHYGAPTNMLDFSTDFIAAIYFAMNPDKDEDKKNITDAAVYLLHPYLFNLAMREMCNNEGIEGFYPLIPTSAYLNEMLKDYIPTNCKNTEVVDRQKRFRERVQKERMADYKIGDLPIAIIVPRTNDRIRSQYGTFVAFPLAPAPDKTDGYNYLNLENLQKEYLKKDGRKPFLKKIIISSSCVSDLRKNLLHLGITQSKMYPELDKLLFDSAEAVKKHLKNN